MIKFLNITFSYKFVIKSLSILLCLILERQFGANDIRSSTDVMQKKTYHLNRKRKVLLETISKHL